MPAIPKVSVSASNGQTAPTIDPPRINRIATDIRALVVPIDSLVPDPNNARLHPDRNMEAIKQSLNQFGQLKPIVVRREDRTVAAGNGTLQAAKELGWTELAAVFVEMTDAEFTGYALADNRTSELARWDYEVVARLDRLLQESEQNPIGWTLKELAEMRRVEWTPPPSDTKPAPGSQPQSQSQLGQAAIPTPAPLPVEDGGETVYDGESGYNDVDPASVIELDSEQWDIFNRAADEIRNQALAEDISAPTDGECLAVICLQFLRERRAEV